MRERRRIPITLRCDECGHKQPITLNLPANMPIESEPPPNLIPRDTEAAEPRKGTEDEVSHVETGRMEFSKTGGPAKNQWADLHCDKCNGETFWIDDPDTLAELAPPKLH